MVEKNPNYCHDFELRRVGARLGLTGQVVNRALSMGEGPYTAFDKAELFLLDQAEKRRQNKLRQPKSRLSRRQKRKILERYRF